MRNVRLAACILLLLVIWCSSILASGFENTGLGTTARGMGGAFRAVADDWTAAYYNPAGYAFIVGDHLGGSLGLVHNRDELTPNFNTQDEFGNVYEWGMLNDNTLYNYHCILNNPAAGFVLRLPVWGETVFGLSAYQPFDHSITWHLFSPYESGMIAYNDSIVNYPYNEFKNDLDVVAFQLTMAKEFNEGEMAFGLGLQILRADLLFSDLTLRTNPREYPFNSRPRDRIPEYIKNEGSGWGYGVRAGFMWKPSEKLNLAVSGYMPFEITLKGDAYLDFYMPLNESLRNQANISLDDRLFVDGEPVGIQSEFETKLTLPASAALGVSYHVTEKILVALDAEYTLWSVYEGLEFVYSNFVGLPDFFDQTVQDRVLINPEWFTANLNKPVEWENAGKVMFGVRYLANDVLTLLGGLSADQSPARISEEFTPQFIDTGDKYGLNIGVQLHINQWDLGIVTSYFSYPELTVEELTDPNGDDMFDNFPGDYKASTYETVLSLGYRF